MSSILTAFQGCQDIKYEKKFIPKGISNLVVQIEKYRVGLAGYFRSGDFSDSVHCMDTAQCWEWNFSITFLYNRIYIINQWRCKQKMFKKADGGIDMVSLILTVVISAVTMMVGLVVVANMESSMPSITTSVLSTSLTNVLTNTGTAFGVEKVESLHPGTISWRWDCSFSQPCSLSVS